MKTQREMPFVTTLRTPQFAPQSVVDGFESYRDAVIWTWENRVNVGAGERMDQAMCANLLGMHTPHMSRCVNRDTNAPMNLSPDLIQDFEAFCGWNSISQWLTSKKQLTYMEQVLAERRIAA